MAQTMSEDELEAALKAAIALEDGDYQGEDEDDYVVATLCRSVDGRHFRHITASGMNSAYSGAANVGEWLDEDELDDWSQFD